MNTNQNEVSLSVVVNLSPWIQMKGKWLEQAGFNIDTPVKIRVMDGCLVLTTEEL